LSRRRRTRTGDRWPTGGARVGADDAGNGAKRGNGRATHANGKRTGANGKAASEPRLLIYSQDGLGLGHLRRTSAIASEFLRARPGACVLTISDSPLGRFFELAPRQDYLKLPSLVKSAPGVWDPLSLPIPTDEIVALRRSLIMCAATSFRPDILLVDHMPHGAQGELLPTLATLGKAGTKLVLGLRDILDAPQVVRRRWRAEGAYSAVEDHYDLALVYGTRAVFDVARQYAWPAPAADVLEYCGYVCASLDDHRSKPVRVKVLPGDGRLLLAMAGGGADAYPLMRALLDGFERVRTTEPCALIIITGPFMPVAQRRDLEMRAQGLPVKVRTTVKDMPSYIAAADVVVSMAGYNTTAEVLRMGKPAVLVPRVGPSAEQRMRARLFAERGWVQLVDPDELTPATIAEAVLHALAPPPATTDAPDLGGLDVAVGHLVSLLEGSKRPRSALLGV